MGLKIHLGGTVVAVLCGVKKAKQECRDMRRRVLGHASRVLDRQSSTSIATVKSLYLRSSAFAPTSPLAKNDPLSELYPPYVFVPNELRHPVDKT